MTTEPTKKVYLTQEEFDKDLEICLTIIEKCDYIIMDINFDGQINDWKIILDEFYYG